MTKRQQNTLRAIKSALASRTLDAETRLGLLDALELCRDQFAEHQAEEQLADVVGDLYKPTFGPYEAYAEETNPAYKQGYNTAVRDVKAIIAGRTKERERRENDGK